MLTSPAKASQLQENLKKFRCCRKPLEETPGKGSLLTEMAAEAAVALQVDDVRDALPFHSEMASDDHTSESSEHLQLFRQMNRWALLDDAQKLQHLQRAEEKARLPRRHLNQAELAEVVSSAAAALSPPRRQIQGVEEPDTEGSSDPNPAPELPGKLGSKPAHVQQRVRVLLLKALRTWRASLFDSHAIEHVLGYIQIQILKFEDRVGWIRCAAAGHLWLSIKQAVDELLQSLAPGHEVRAADRAFTKCRDTAMRRQERQSGIQGICWNRFNMTWQLSLREAGKKKLILFPISKFLQLACSMARGLVSRCLQCS